MIHSKGAGMHDKREKTVGGEIADSRISLHLLIGNKHVNLSKKMFDTQKHISNKL